MKANGNKMLKILVTGATGFVGRCVVPHLIEAGHEVLCAVSRKVDTLSAKQVITDRIENQSNWKEILQGIDVVIHLAARVHVMRETIASPWDEFYKINSLATKNLAEQAAQSGVKRFVFLSSIKVNGEFTLEHHPFTEEHTAQPMDPYAKSKLLAEQFLISTSQEYGMEFVILRPPLIFGPDVKANFLKMLQLVQKRWPLPFGSIPNKRSFLYVENLASALCAVVSNSKAANQLYLLADDDSWSLSDLLIFLAQQMDVRLRLFSIPGLLTGFRLFGLKNLQSRLFNSLEIRNCKIKSQLNWNPPFSSAQGLANTVTWYKNESSL